MYIHLKTTLMTTFFFSFLIDQKHWREKKEERGKEQNVSIREKVT